MKQDLKKLFSYCEIPKWGQKQFCSMHEPLATTIQRFKAHPYLFKHLDISAIICRFFWNEKEIPYFYHYLDKDDLIKIIRGRKFFIGNQDDMNDPLEKKYIPLKALHILQHTNASNKKLEYLRELVFNNELDTYVWSFTQNPYSYAMQNYGNVAFAINTKSLVEQSRLKLKIFSEKQNDRLISMFNFFCPIKVCYDSKIQKEYIECALNFFEKICEEDSISNVDLLYMLVVFKLYSLIFKNPLLYEEQEYRIIIGGFKDDRWNDLSDIKIKNKSKLIGYVLPSNLTKIIVNHKIGASQNIDEVIVELETVLREEGYINTALIKTRLPY